MSTLTARKCLDLFIKRSEELQSLRLVKQGFSTKYSFNWSIESGKLICTSVEPDEEDFRSFLLLFRQFIANDEPININKIFNICEQNLSDEKIKNQVRDLRTKWIQSFRKISEFELNIEGKTLTSEYVLDLWINGYYFHNDSVKAAKLEELSKGQIPFTRMQLFTTLPLLIGVILGVGRGIAKSLNDEKFVFNDEIIT